MLQIKNAQIPIFSGLCALRVDFESPSPNFRGGSFHNTAQGIGADACFVHDASPFYVPLGKDLPLAFSIAYPGWLVKMFLLKIYNARGRGFFVDPIDKQGNIWYNEKDIKMWRKSKGETT